VKMTYFNRAWRPRRLAKCCLVLALLLPVASLDTPRSTTSNLPAISEAPAITTGGDGAKDPMNELLHWAIEHSDPEKLKELMQQYKDRNLTLKDLHGQELIDAFFKTEADVMVEQIAVISDWQNASMEEGVLEAALEELEENLHQIDNAGNLHRMGGMVPLLELGLGRERSEEIRSSALHALGVAVQNNAPVQKELASLDGLKRLANHLQRCEGNGDSKSPEDASPQFCGKLLFTISGLVKNEADLQAEADTLGIIDWMLDVGARHPSLAVARKALALVETVLAQNSMPESMNRLPMHRAALASVLLGRVRGAVPGDFDIDLSEKALALISRLLSRRPMLFAASFQQELSEAVKSALEACHANIGDDEICRNLAGLASEADRILSAQHISDDEL